MRIGETAPNFEADTTQGHIKFYDWLGDSWGVLFSHPKNFTPVCTTELGYMARMKPEFDKRNTKIIGLSVDPADKHAAWAKDIEETQGAAVNYPMIGDPSLEISKLYDMLPAEAGVTQRRPHRRRQPDRAQRLCHWPGQEDQADHQLSDDHGTQLRRDSARARLACSSPPSTASRRPSTGSMARTSSSPARSATTKPRRSTRMAGKSRSPISASCRSPKADPFQTPISTVKLAPRRPTRGFCFEGAGR